MVSTPGARWIFAGVGCPVHGRLLSYIPFLHLLGELLGHDYEQRLQVGRQCHPLVEKVAYKGECLFLTSHHLCVVC